MPALNWEIKRAIRHLVIALLGWPLLGPIAFMVPKRRGLVVVIGRQGGLFVDNAKHFFAAVVEMDPPIPPVWLSEDLLAVEQLHDAGATAVLYPKWRAIWTLLRASVVVYDALDWIDNGRLQLAWKAAKVQLWHGAPLKEIELTLFETRLRSLSKPIAMLLRFYKWLTGRYVVSDLLVSPSPFYTSKVFQHAIHHRHIREYGYSRNDAMLRSSGLREGLAWINTDTDSVAYLCKKRAAGYSLVLYAPTFRIELESPFVQAGLNMQAFSDFLSDHRIVVVAKLHPSLSGRVNLDTLDNIIEYDAGSDIYPIFSFFDMMIADYSSMAFDFLLLDRPIVYFPFDFEDYVTRQRRLLFKFDDMSPGPVCANQSELQEAIENCLQQDAHAMRRRELRDKIFQVQDGRSSARIWDHIRQQYG